MPSERFRDPDTGRWVTRQVASGPGNFLRELFSGNVRESQEEIVNVPAPVANWEVDEGSKWGVQWSAIGDMPLNLDAVVGSEPPWGTDEYRVVVYMPSDPRYPNGVATAGPFHISEWPPKPEMWEPRGGTGIAAIRFRFR